MGKIESTVCQHPCHLAQKFLKGLFIVQMDDPKQK